MYLEHERHQVASRPRRIVVTGPSYPPVGCKESDGPPAPEVLPLDWIEAAGEELAIAIERGHDLRPLLDRVLSMVARGGAS